MMVISGGLNSAVNVLVLSLTANSTNWWFKIEL